MADNELAFTPATDLLRLIATKQVSPVELTELYFDRIDRLDSRLNSYLLLTRDEALSAARAAEGVVMRGEELGALHGLPISIKGHPDDQGSPDHRGGRWCSRTGYPTGTRAVVERVREAGAIMLGKTNSPEFGLVGTCENLLGDHGRNPWNTDRTPGGSQRRRSRGHGCLPVSAGHGGATAGGSIRIPASFCGIYGIKPTQGRVSSYTGLEGPGNAELLRPAGGPLSRTVRDSAPAAAGNGRVRLQGPRLPARADPGLPGRRGRGRQRLAHCLEPGLWFRGGGPRGPGGHLQGGAGVRGAGVPRGGAGTWSWTRPTMAYGPIYEVAAYASYGQYLESHGGPADVLCQGLHRGRIEGHGRRLCPGPSA